MTVFERKQSTKSKFRVQKSSTLPRKRINKNLQFHLHAEKRKNGEKMTNIRKKKKTITPLVMTGLTYSDDKNSDEVCTEELENQFNSSSNNLCKIHFTPTGMPAHSSGPYFKIFWA